MSDNKSTGNPMFDLWRDGQEQFFKMQSDWLNPNAKSVMEDAIDPSALIDKSAQAWQQCEEQFNHWTNAAGSWFTPTTEQSSVTDEDKLSSDALHYMLNPQNFLKSGFDQMNQVFRKMVDGPEFADIGMLEKKVLKSSRDWLAFQEATDQYQTIIASAWSRAFQRYSDEYTQSSKSRNISAKTLLAHWLKIADEELVSTLRSEDFLQAQSQLFSTGTQYKLKHKEFAEMWCESHTIPTRSEVDDLHAMIYELRREVRALKKAQSAQNTAKSTANNKTKSATKNTVKKVTPTPARQKSSTKSQRSTTPKDTNKTENK